MKTQILQLEPHDDVVSARDKMGWGQAGRILLVWPSRGRLLTRRLDLVLLQRHSLELGAQLALVTRDRDVRFHARRLAIPTFTSLKKAQRSIWKSSRHRYRRWPILPDRPEQPRPDLAALREQAQPPRPAWLERPAARLGFFTLGVLALLAIAAILLPGAEVTLAPRAETQEFSLALEASPKVQDAQLSGQVPVHTISVIVEGRDQAAASGAIRIPGQPAAGQVTLTNLTGRPVHVPEGTVIRTLEENPVRFATTRPASVPGGPGEAITVPVRALLGGRSGNLPANRLAAIEGSLGSSLTAANPRPTLGGTDLRGPAPRPEDYERLYQRLEQSLRQSALQELESMLKPGDVLLSAIPSLSQVLEKAYDPAEPQPADWLHLNLRLEYEVSIASEEDLLFLAESVLDGSLPPGFKAVPDSLQIRPLTEAAASGQGAYRWRMKAQRRIQAQIVEAQAVSLALGLAPAQAGRRLADSISLDKPPQITLAPSWWPRLPVVPFRIEVEVIR